MGLQNYFKACAIKLCDSGACRESTDLCLSAGTGAEASSQQQLEGEPGSPTGTSSAPLIGGHTGIAARVYADLGHGLASTGSGSAALSGEALSHAAAGSEASQAQRTQHAIEPAPAAQQPGANGHHQLPGDLCAALLST